MVNNKIRRILTEELLLEAASLEKILNALAKDPDGPDGSQSELADLIMTDPTSVTNSRGQFVGKYWKWIYAQYKRGNIKWGDMPELESALNTYNINKSRINKPIDTFNTLDELVQEVSMYDDSFKATRTISKGEQELEKVYEDRYVTVYVPHTWEAARKIGGDTKWCTASSNDHYFNMYKNRYGGEYYDIIRKSDGAKFQIHPESGQFMDALDHRVNFAIVFETYDEANGLMRFLESKGKDIEKWKPKTWFCELDEKLAEGVDPKVIFDFVGPGDGNHFVKVELNHRWNYLKPDGTLLSPNLWFDACNDLPNGGVAKVGVNGKQNYINFNGKILFNNWFDFIGTFDVYGYAVVKANGKINYIDVHSQDLIFKNWISFGFVDKRLRVGYVTINGKKYIVLGNGDLTDYETGASVNPGEVAGVEEV